MLVRLLFISLLAASTFAGDLFDNWPAGKTETLLYNINTIKPQKTSNSLKMTVTRTTAETPEFIIEQALDIINQGVSISVTETYTGKDLQLTKTTNLFRFPPEATAQLGVDSLVITGTREGDSLDITSTLPRMVPPCKVAMDKELVTSSGSLLTTRNMEFKKGTTRTFRFVNLLVLTGQVYSPVEIIDSVAGEMQVTVPAGTFDCYKVKNTSPGGFGYSYYSKDKGHAPVRTELIDPATNEVVMEVVLTKRE